jgi:DUF1365 family protein
MLIKDAFKFASQGLSVFYTFVWSVLCALSYTPYALLCITLRNLLSKLGIIPATPNATATAASFAVSGAAFYKGMVMHSRKKPKENSFVYPVRIALINLDSPPSWWTPGAGDTLTADEARSTAGTAGPVHLLTHPPSAGYTQNPISVYYCYGLENTKAIASKTTSRVTRSSSSLKLEKCLAEVTNTPWGERVTFAFLPADPTNNTTKHGQNVPKALHVSPLMDMTSTWTVKAPPPTSSKLFLSVASTHPEYGDYFIAALDAKLDTDAPALPNEIASIGTLMQFGFQPQRVAFWIYWQAVVLLWKGVRFFPPPAPEDYQKKAEDASKHPKTGNGRYFVWRKAQGWPWR